MADPTSARPVSGEIMMDVPQAAGRPRTVGKGRSDTVDAQYETVMAPGRPPKQPDVRRSDAGAVSMDILRPPRSTAKKAASRGSPLFWMIGIVVAAAAFWVSGGHVAARNAGFLAASPAGPSPSILAVTWRVDGSGQRPILRIDGDVANEGTGPGAVPPLLIAVTANDGLVMRYRLGTSSDLLPPGEKFTFSSRLDVPKDGIKSVSVTFGR